MASVTENITFFLNSHFFYISKWNEIPPCNKTIHHSTFHMLRWMQFYLFCVFLKKNQFTYRLVLYFYSFSFGECRENSKADISIFHNIYRQPYLIDWCDFFLSHGTISSPIILLMFAVVGIVPAVNKYRGRWNKHMVREFTSSVKKQFIVDNVMFVF
jgi:hypothetical protein